MEIPIQKPQRERDEKRSHCITKRSACDLGIMSLIFRGSAPPCTTLPECDEPSSMLAMILVGLSAWPCTPMQH